MKNRAIITDLDGTILPKGGSISSETISAFQQAGEKGCIRIIATGRNLYAAHKALPQNFPIDYLVFSSGAGILRWADQQLLFARHLNQQEAREIAGYLWNYNINFTIQREIPENHHFYYTTIYPLHEDYRQRLETYASFGTPIESPSDICGKVTQFVVILDALQLRLPEQMRRELPGYSVVRSTSPIDHKAIWLEIFSAGINKGTTCQQLLQELNINLPDCAGLGNDYNDVDFLNICGQSFLVKNAPEHLKPHYKSVASVRNNGFAEFVSKIL